MDSSYIIIFACGALVILCGTILACFYILRAHPRTAGLEALNSSDEQPQAAQPSEEINSVSLRGLSERLAVLEGVLPALRTQLDNYAAMAQRLQALESYVPGIADQYESLTDAMGRKDKRDKERERRGGLKTAGEAAENLLATLPGSSAPAPTNGGGRTRPLGIKGHGGRIKRDVL